MLSTSLPLVLVFVALTGIGTFMPFSVFVILSQDYLPNRIGTASGVTIGLAVSIGGLFSPLLGWLADSTSLRFTLSTLIALPILALLLSAPRARNRRAERTGGDLPALFPRWIGMNNERASTVEFLLRVSQHFGAAWAQRQRRSGCDAQGAVAGSH